MAENEYTIREKLKDVKDGDHAGLILARYLVKQETDEKKKRDESSKHDQKATGSGKKSSRKDLYKRAQKATGKASAIYTQAFNRWKKAWESDNDLMRSFDVKRMIIGLGADNVLEAGLTLHHTYGVPYIPGSAVKGLCAHYCHELSKSKELGADFQMGDKKEKREDGKAFAAIFGNQNQAGMIRFHDTLIEPESLEKCLKDDVMTPHHTEYYGSTDETAPTDFDSPVPVTFLSVSGKFLFVISCDDVDESGMVTDEGKKWINFVWNLLEGALANKGIGGKTNSGYGFVPLVVPEEPPPPPKEWLKKGDKRTLTRLSKTEAKKFGKEFLFVDEEGTPCIVKNDEEKEIKKLVPNPGDTIELIYVTEQTQNKVKFLQFCLPKVE